VGENALFQRFSKSEGWKLVLEITLGLAREAPTEEIFWDGFVNYQTGSQQKEGYSSQMTHNCGLPPKISKQSTAGGHGKRSEGR